MPKSDNSRKFLGLLALFASASTGCITIVNGNQNNSASALVTADVSAQANINTSNPGVELKNESTPTPSPQPSFFPEPLDDSWKSGPNSWKFTGNGPRELRVYAKSKIQNLPLVLKKPQNTNWSIEWKPAQNNGDWNILAYESMWSGSESETREMPIRLPSAGSFDFRITMPIGTSWEAILGENAQGEQTLGNSNAQATVIHQSQDAQWRGPWPPEIGVITPDTPKVTPSKNFAWKATLNGERTLKIHLHKETTVKFEFERDVTANWRVSVQPEGSASSARLIGDESLFPGNINRNRVFFHHFPQPGTYEILIWIQGEDDWTMIAGEENTKEQKDWQFNLIAELN